MIDWGSFWAGAGLAVIVIFSISAIVIGALARSAPVVDGHEEELLP